MGTFNAVNAQLKNQYPNLRFEYSQGNIKCMVTPEESNNLRNQVEVVIREIHILQNMK